MDLSINASKKVRANKTTLKNIHKVLDYLAKNPDVTIRFHASEMILNIHSYAYYISNKNAKSFASRHLFLGSVPKDG